MFHWGQGTMLKALSHLLEKAQVQQPTAAAVVPEPA
jgi:hypothetical protein